VGANPVVRLPQEDQFPVAKLINMFRGHAATFTRRMLFVLIVFGGTKKTIMFFFYSPQPPLRGKPTVK
jgi:hypothetical protein